MGQDTAAMMALKFPHLAPFAEELDETLGIIKSQNDGHGRIVFEAQGIDHKGNLIVKYIDAGLRRILGKKKSNK